MLKDLRLGLRMLLKNPAFSAVVVLTLALGIGAKVSLFSVVNGVLLNPLPFPQPEQLVTLAQSKPNFESGAIPYPNFRDLQKENRTFSAMAISRGTGFSLVMNRTDRTHRSSRRNHNADHLARRTLRGTHAPEESRYYFRRDSRFGARHWGQHGHLQRC